MPAIFDRQKCQMNNFFAHVKVLTIGTKARCLQPSGLLLLRAPVCRPHPNSPFAVARQAQSALVHDAPSWDPENPRLRARPPAHFIGFQLSAFPFPFCSRFSPRSTLEVLSSWFDV